MTEYQVEIGTQAQADIMDIMRYIGETLQEPRTAGNLYRRLKEEISSLNQMPERCPYKADDRLRALGIREKLQGSLPCKHGITQGPNCQSGLCGTGHLKDFGRIRI